MGLYTITTTTTINYYLFFIIIITVIDHDGDSVKSCKNLVRGPRCHHDLLSLLIFQEFSIFIF